MLQTIAIIGRPNVGKSTLFNALTQSRQALVSDYPGLTRDRMYGECNIKNFQFLIIDTGGIETHDLEKKAPTDIENLLFNQVNLAIEEADQIIFLVDGRAGVTGPDEQLAKQLRKVDKPIQLVINKSEGLDPSTTSADFFRLGLGDPVLIAASHRHGIEKLINHLNKDQLLNKIEDDSEKIDTIKIAIVGKPNVGKSTLVNRILGEERVIVFDEPGTTRDSVFIPFEKFGKHYTLIDTAGVRRRAKVSEVIEKFSVIKTIQAIKTANVILFLIDAQSGITEQDLRLLGHILESGRALVIGINKWDGMGEYKKQRIFEEIDRRFEFVGFAKKHFISALHGTGVGHLLEFAEKAYHASMQKISTPKLTKAIEQIVEDHQPPLVQNKRVKVRYAHLGGNNPPRIVIHGSRCQLLPKSYQRYIQNALRKKFDFLGTPIRLEFKSKNS